MISELKCILRIIDANAILPDVIIIPNFISVFIAFEIFIFDTII